MGEIRVTFTEKEEELERFVKSKTSGAGFLKDLARIEMQREKVYINGISFQNENSKDISNDNENSKDTNKNVYSIDDLSIDDLNINDLHTKK